MKVRLRIKGYKERETSPTQIANITKTILFFIWGDHIDQPALFESIISGEYEYEEEYWSDISPLAKSFIDSLLVRPAEKRPSAEHALNHPWFRAMLEQDMVTPLSPADSVNLLPGFRKNFNARKVFKKAVRAVGILRKMQTAGSSGSFGSTGEELQSRDSFDTTSSRKSRPLSFQDIVAAAVVSKKGLDGVQEHDDEEVHETLEKLDIKNA